jgi:hypothetical protein
MVMDTLNSSGGTARSYHDCPPPTLATASVTLSREVAIVPATPPRTLARECKRAGEGYTRAGSEQERQLRILGTQCRRNVHPTLCVLHSINTSVSTDTKKVSRATRLPWLAWDDVGGDTQGGVIMCGVWCGECETREETLHPVLGMPRD